MQLWVRRRVVHRRRDRLVLQTEDGLDQTHDSGRRIKVTDVRLHRPDHARTGPLTLARIKSLSQGFDFDRVAQRRARAMRLDVADGRSVDSGDGLRFGDDFRLAGHRRCRVGHLHRAVVVDR